jgi:uncharacterized protein (DUF2147 family)
MVRWKAAATGLCLGLVVADPAAVASPDLAGDWARDDGAARIAITQCGTQLCATNTWVRDSSGGEAVGDKLVMTLKRSSDSVWDGEARDQKRNLTLSMRISVSEGNKMITYGCVLFGVVCKTVNWTRS